MTKQKKQKTYKTELIVVLDRSLSMGSISKDMCVAFNTLISDQKKISGDCKVSLHQFDHEYEDVYVSKELATVPELNLVPRGSTALLDALGKTINHTRTRIESFTKKEKPDNLIFVVITDGEENCSKEFSKEKIFELITKCREETKWEFIYLGANQDAIKVAKNLGMSTNNAVTYTADNSGTKGVFRGLSDAIGSSRITGNVSDSMYSQVDYNKTQNISKGKNE